MRDWSDLKSHVTPVPRQAVLDLAVRLAHPVAGDIIEFGVWEGESARAIRATLDRCEQASPDLPRKRIFACDSFKGLPERFEQLEAGAFACDPPDIPGVEIVVGLFQDSLTDAFARRVGSVALAFLDADLYSSTRCALNWLTPLVHPGTLLLFDEFLGEHESERRAFEDWSRETGVETLLVADFLRNPSGCGGIRADRRVLYQIVSGGALAPAQRPG